MEWLETRYAINVWMQVVVLYMLGSLFSLAFATSGLLTGRFDMMDARGSTISAASWLLVAAVFPGITILLGRHFASHDGSDVRLTARLGCDVILQAKVTALAVVGVALLALVLLYSTPECGDPVRPSDMMSLPDHGSWAHGPG